jgi:aspartate kinase
VTHTTEETVFSVDRVPASTLFSALADAGVNVDTILQTSTGIVFSAPATDRAEAESALDGLGVTWSAREDLGKVSLIGAGMKTHPGVAAKMFATLEELGIVPEIVNTSPIKIACFVSRDDVERAVQGLHAAFELHSPDAERRHA